MEEMIKFDIKRRKYAVGVRSRRQSKLKKQRVDSTDDKQFENGTL